MGIVIRQSVKATVVSYIGFSLGYVNVLLLFPYFFTPEEFGLTRILIAVASIVVQFAHLGMANVTVQFLPHFRGLRKETGSFFYFTLLTSTAGFFLSALVLFLFKNKILDAYREQSPLFVQYYYYVLPIAFFILIAAIVEAFARANYRIAFPVLIRDVILRILTAAVIVVFFFKMVDFGGFLQLFTFIYLIPVFLQFIYLKRLGELHFNFNLNFLDKKLFSQMLNYGLFTMLVGSASMLVGNLDVLMVSSFLGLSATAIYSVGFFIGTLIEIPTRSISQITTTVVADAWKKNDLEKISEMYKKTALNQTIFGSLLFIGIWANVDNLFKFLPEIYSQGKWVIFFIALSKLTDMVTGINSEIIMTSKYYRFNFYIMLLLIALTVATNFIFIPLYGLPGAAVAAVISMVIFNLAKFIFLWLKFRLQPFSVKTIPALLIPLAVLFASYLIPVQNNFIADIIIRSLAIVVVFMGLVLWLKISEEVNGTFYAIINKAKRLMWF